MFRRYFVALPFTMKCAWHFVVFFLAQAPRSHQSTKGYASAVWKHLGGIKAALQREKEDQDHKRNRKPWLRLLREICSFIGKGGDDDEKADEQPAE